MKALPIQLQIEVLESARASLIKDHTPWSYPLGLCFYIQVALQDFKKNTGKDGTIIYYPEIKEYIPLFTRSNAKIFDTLKDEKTAYWWPVGDFRPRIDFIDWMLETLKEELK